MPCPLFNPPIKNQKIESSHRLRRKPKLRVLNCEIWYNKINVASIGNKVRQLHVHTIARRVDDSAWPGTVWDKGPAVPYDRDSVLQRVSMLRDAIAVLKIN
jgi:diadenosine tetraphosphate (Ap4A) HIT family hydrolase